jgi:hypothetical protein
MDVRTQAMLTAHQLRGGRRRTWDELLQGPPEIPQVLGPEEGPEEPLTFRPATQGAAAPAAEFNPFRSRLQLTETVQPPRDEDYVLPRVDELTAANAAVINSRKREGLARAYQELGYDVPEQAASQEDQAEATEKNLAMRHHMGDRAATENLAARHRADLAAGVSWADILAGRTPSRMAAAERRRAAEERQGAQAEEGRRWEAEHGLKSQALTQAGQQSTAELEFRERAQQAQQEYQNKVLAADTALKQGTLTLQQSQLEMEKADKERKAALEQAALELQRQKTGAEIKAMEGEPQRKVGEAVQALALNPQIPLEDVAQRAQAVGAPLPGWAAKLAGRGEGATLTQTPEERSQLEQALVATTTPTEFADMVAQNRPYLEGNPRMVATVARLFQQKFGAEGQREFEELGRYSGSGMAGLQERVEKVPMAAGAVATPAAIGIGGAKALNWGASVIGLRPRGSVQEIRRRLEALKMLQPQPAAFGSVGSR